MLTTVGKVRDIMGLGQDTGITDAVIIEMIKIAQEKLKHDLYKHHYDETPEGCWIDGSLWNGNNVRFTINFPVMDSNFDGKVDGDDIIGYWFNSDNNTSSCSITVVDSRYGHIKIYQSDGSTPIPSNAKDIKLEYYTLKYNVNSQMLSDLCTYLTCHLVSIAIAEPDKITVADIEGNQQRMLLEIDKKNSKYRYMYMELLNRYRSPRFRST